MLLSRRVVTLLICAVLIFSASAFADGVGAEKVRVGFFAFDGYHMIGENGELSGYGYDFLQYMSTYTELEFEFVGYEASWGEAQDMLERGEIDILTSAQRTDERLARFDFSDRPIGMSSAILTVKAGNTRFILDDYPHWSGMRVGMLTGNSRNDSFAEFAVKNGFTYTAEYFEDTADMVRALEDGGSVDAIVTSNLRRTDGEWMLAQFDASPFYIMVRKGDSELLGEINAALDRLYIAMPVIDELLMDKYYLTSDGHNTAFTAEERAFIEKSRSAPVNVGVIPGSEPVCYFDAATGEYRGISMDILRIISSKTGLYMAYLPIDLSGNSPVGWLKSGEYDMVAGILKSKAFTDDASLLLSDELITDSIVLVGLSGAAFFEDSGLPIAVPQGFQVGHAFATARFPNCEIETYPTFDDCMRAVMNRRAQAVVYMRACVSYALQNPHYEELAILPAYSEEICTCTAATADGGSVLMSIIDKGLAMIDEGERSAIMLNYTILNPYELSLSDTLYKYQAPVHIIAALAFFIILALVTIIYMRRRSSRALRAAYENTREALAQAERANASKSQFLSRVSHEMRTPLNAIIGFIELFKTAEPHESKAYLQNIDIASKQLLAVINDVLDMSSIEAGKLSLSKAPFDFKRLIHSLTNVYLPQCTQKGLAFDVKILTPVDEWLVGDQLRLNQILYNFLNNSVKFTKSGHIDLLISQTANGENEAFIRLQVEDTGCGMSEELMSRLFNPFEQESSATAVKYGGSGLGLSIVKNLVTMMNGAIRVDSRPGEGSMFTVDIPFEKAKPQTEVKALGNDLRVLAVDDEESERNYIKIVLDRMKVRNRCVGSGEDALNELKAASADGDPYQVCLVDWRMPNMDGIETTRTIRGQFGDNMLVIVVSAYEHGAASKEVLDAGANLFIPKPLFQSSLCDLLMKLTDGRLGDTPPDGDAPDVKFDSRRVLLSEDNLMNRIITEALIKKLGLMCECAENGEVACEMFENAPVGYYDAILMDIQMPVLDGYEATKRIRASGRPDADEIQIIALTANAFNEDIAKSLSAGMNAHVSKPIEHSALVNALAKAFAATEKTL